MIGPIVLLVALAAAPAGGSVPAVESVRRLASEDAAVRSQASRELLAMGPTAIPCILDAAASTNLVLAMPARELLPAFGPKAIRPLIEAAQVDAGKRDALWEEATNTVVRMGRAALPEVLCLFTSTYPYEPRWYFSVGVLARMDGLAVEPLMPLLKHPTKEVREEAATLLANFGDPRSFEALMEGLRSKDPVVRMHCARALGKIGDHRAGDVLLIALKDPGWGTRAAASAALASMYEPRFLEPIVCVARGDSEVMTRDTAASVLITTVRDPVSVRLGKRYKPIAMSPARRGAIIARDLRLLGITGLCLLGIGAWGAYAVGRMKAWRRWLSAGTAAAAVVALGLIWGRVVENISGTVENALLLVVVPAAGLFGIAVVVLASRDQPDRWLRRVAWLGTMGCFYAGYGIGWLVLWGYLGA